MIEAAADGDFFALDVVCEFADTFTDYSINVN